MTEANNTCAIAPACTSAGKNSSFAGDVLKVVFGASSSQLFSILAAPLLTRMFAPEAFGLMAVYSSLVGIVGVMAGLRYEQAILLPEHDEEAANVLALSLLITLGLSCTLASLLFLFGSPILRFLNASNLRGYAWFIPAAILVSGGYTSMVMWNLRRRDFALISSSRALSSGLSNACQLSFGAASWTSVGSLLGGAFIGNVLALVMVAAGARRRSRRLLLESVRWARLRWAARRYSEFPLYNTWGILLNTLSWQLPALLLARYFGSASAGYFSIGMRVLSIPMDLIAVSIGQVFFQRAAEARANGSLGVVVEAAVRRLITFSLFPILVLGLIAPDLFMVALGARWHEGGVYVRLLAPWICIWFVASPLSVLINVLERQRFGVVLNSAIFATRLGSLYVGYLLNSVYFALAIFSATGLVVYGWLAIQLIHDSGAHARCCVPLSLKGLILVLPVAGAITWLKWLGAGSLFQAAVGAAAIIAYLSYEALRDAALVQALTGRFRG